MFRPSLMLLIALLLPSQDRAAPARATIADLGWLAAD